MAQLPYGATTKLLTRHEFRHLRVVHMLVLIAVIGPLLSFFGMSLLALPSWTKIWRAKRRRLICQLGAALLSTGSVSAQAVLGGNDASALLAFLGTAAGFGFGAVSLSLPTWLAIPLRGEHRPIWQSLGDTAVLCCAAMLPPWPKSCP